MAALLVLVGSWFLVFVGLPAAIRWAVGKGIPNNPDGPDPAVVRYNPAKNRRKLARSIAMLVYVALLWIPFSLAVLLSRGEGSELVWTIAVMCGGPIIFFCLFGAYAFWIYRSQRDLGYALRLLPAALAMTSSGVEETVPKETILFYRYPWHRNKRWLEIHRAGGAPIIVPFVFDNVDRLQRTLDDWGIEQRQPLKRKAYAKTWWRRELGLWR